MSLYILYIKFDKIVYEFSTACIDSVNVLFELISLSFCQLNFKTKHFIYRRGNEKLDYFG
jgi:hypothetical protein